MKLTYIRRSLVFVEDYNRLQLVKTILLEDKNFQKLLNEAFSTLFLRKYPEFDKDLISTIVARLQIILNDQVEAGRGTDINPKDVRGVIYQELLDSGVKELRVTQLIGDDMVIKNFIQGFYERPEFVKIQQKVRNITGKKEMIPQGPLKQHQIGLTRDPMAGSGAGSVR